MKRTCPATTRSANGSSSPRMSGPSSASSATSGSRPRAPRASPRSISRTPRFPRRDHRTTSPRLVIRTAAAPATPSPRSAGPSSAPTPAADRRRAQIPCPSRGRDRRRRAQVSLLGAFAGIALLSPRSAFTAAVARRVAAWAGRAWHAPGDRRRPPRDPPPWRSPTASSGGDQHRRSAWVLAYAAARSVNFSAGVEPGDVVTFGVAVS